MLKDMLPFSAERNPSSLFNLLKMYNFLPKTLQPRHTKKNSSK